MVEGRWGVHVPTLLAAIRDFPDYRPADPGEDEFNFSQSMTGEVRTGPETSARARPLVLEVTQLTMIRPSLRAQIMNKGIADGQLSRDARQ